MVTQGEAAGRLPKHIHQGWVERDKLVCGDATTAVLTQCPVVRRWVGLANCTPSLGRGRAARGGALMLECSSAP